MASTVSATGKNERTGSSDYFAGVVMVSLNATLGFPVTQGQLYSVRSL